MTPQAGHKYLFLKSIFAQDLGMSQGDLIRYQYVLQLICLEGVICYVHTLIQNAWRYTCFNACMNETRGQKSMQEWDILTKIRRIWVLISLS